MIRALPLVPPTESTCDVWRPDDVFDGRVACAQAGVSQMPVLGPMPKSAAKRIVGAFPVLGPVRPNVLWRVG